MQAAISIAAVLFWILMWKWAAEAIAVSFILPKPEEVFLRLWELMKTSDFYRILFLSFLRVMAGFFWGGILGFLFGTAAHFFYPLRALLNPLMAMVRATPVASFILVVILLAEREEVPTVISLMMVLPVVWQNTLLGFSSRDPKLTEMAKVFSIGPIRRFFRVDLPQVLPFVFSAAQTSLGLAWKAGVAAEVLALPKVSVGMMIYDAKLYLQTPDLYAWTLAIIAFSVLLERLLLLSFAGKGGNHA